MTNGGTGLQARQLLYRKQRLNRLGPVISLFVRDEAAIFFV